MPPLAELQRRFAAALADPALPPPAGTARRFGVHRNNVQAGIASVLEARFPAVRRLVGEEFFAAMAAVYAAQDPPRSPILLLYGAGFPAFVATFDPAADVPYLSDVAQLEWLIHEATHAADATALRGTDLAAIPPEDVALLKLRLHPSLRLLASPYPALTLWEINSRPGDIAAQTLTGGPEYALILRPALEVEIRRIDAGFFGFCQALLAGAPLAAAVDAATSRHDHFDVQNSLAALIAMGAIAGYDLAYDLAAAGR